MKILHTVKDSVLHLFYPHICAGCGSDVLPANSQICISCIYKLPQTGFEKHAQNPVEKMLAGRIQFENATAQYYFNKGAILQQIMHDFKYRGNKELGRQLGVIMGNSIKNSARFHNIDVLVPLPLFNDKERKRGYNQATILCQGMAEALHIEIAEDVIVRPRATETQTKKSRVERWQNMEGKFELIHAEKLQGSHVLLVDDVITTGATLEACATALLQVQNLKLSIAALCYASNI